MRRPLLAVLPIGLSVLVSALAVGVRTDPADVRAAWNRIGVVSVPRAAGEADVLLEPAPGLPRRSTAATAGTADLGAPGSGRARLVGRVVSDRPDQYGVTTGRATLGRSASVDAPPHASDSQGWGGVNPVWITEFDGEGRFEFPHVAPGTWTLRAAADEFGLVTREIVVSSSDEVVEVELHAAPSFRMRLTASLELPGGGDLFELPPGVLRARARGIVPVFLEECPAIGAPLPEGARRLTQFSRNVVGKRPASWVVTTFPEPTRGWMCALLDDAVLEAVPIYPGVDRVRMRVDPERLAAAKPKEERLWNEPVYSSCTLGPRAYGSGRQ